MIRLLFFCFLYLNVISCFSTQFTDSLERKISKADELTKLKLYNVLDSAFILSNPQKAAEYAEKAIELSKKLGNTQEESEAYLYYGKYYGMSGEFDKSLDYLTKSLNIKQTTKDKKGIGNIYSVLGNLYKSKGDSKSAYEYIQKALKIRYEIKDSIGLASSLNNLGILYKDWGNYETALDYYQKSLKISEVKCQKDLISAIYTNIGNIYLELKRIDDSHRYYLMSIKLKEETNDIRGIASNYTDLGNIFLAKKELDSAKYYYLKSLNIAKPNNLHGITCNVLNNLGELFNEKKVYDSAYFYYNSSLEIGRQLNNKNVETACLLNLGDIFLQQKKYPQSLNYLHQSMKIAREFGLLYYLIDIYSTLSDYYSQTNNYKEALNFKNQFITLKDSIMNNDLKKRISNMQMAYEVEKKEREIELLKKDNELLEKNSAIQKNQSFLLYILSAFILILGIVLYNRYITKQKANVLLTEKNEEITRQKEQLEIANNDLQNQYQFLQILIDSIPNPIFFKDIDGRYLGCNKDFEKFTNKTKKQIIGKTIHEIMDKKLADFTEKHDRECLASKNPIRYEAKLNEETGKPVDVIYIKSKYYNFAGEIGGIIGIIHDITNIKKTQNILRESEEKLKKLNDDKDKYLEIIESDLERASKYIYAHLPKRMDKNKIRTNWLFNPSSQLGGDSFGYHWIDDKNFAFYLLDVSGHGIGASLHSLTVLNTINYHSLQNTDYRNPEEVFNSLNNIFQLKEHNNMFFTIWYGVYNVDSMELTYSSAGHPPALLYSPDRNIIHLSNKNIFIGGTRAYVYQSEKIKLRENSKIYIFSDGVYEIKKTDNSYWDYDDLKKFLRSNTDEINDSELNLLFDYVKSMHGSQNLEDDFSLLKVTFY
jgi:PAS domain S-box-containing protein